MSALVVASNYVFDVGDVVRSRGVFRNTSNRALVDPTDVYVQVEKPDGSITSYHYGIDLNVLRESIGSYTVDVPADQSGNWFVRFYSTGLGQAAQEERFGVRKSRFSNV